MKKTTIKIISTVLLLILLLGAFSSCFAAFEPLTTENLTTAFATIETDTNSAVEFDVTESNITVSSGSNNYSFSFSASDRTFTKQVELTDGLSEAEISRVEPELLSAIYGYIASSVVQGKSVTNSTNYIVDELKNMDNYVREKLVSEGASYGDEHDSSETYEPSEILTSSLFDNILDGLSTHVSGDISYSDGHTFSLKISKSVQNTITLSLNILDNDFSLPSTSQKSMSYNLTTIIRGQAESSDSAEASKSDNGSSTSNSKETDSTTSKAGKIPQTGRSYTANNAVIFAIIVTILLILGMIAYDIRKNKRN